MIINNLNSKRFITLFVLFLFVFSANAQQKEISGTVNDQSNKSLPGANVSVKGSKNAVSTDFDGKFKIKVNEGDEISISFIGFQFSYICARKCVIP